MDSKLRGKMDQFGVPLMSLYNAKIVDNRDPECVGVISGVEQG